MKLFISIILIFFYFNLPVFAGYPIVRNFTGNIYKSGAQNWAISQHESNIMYFANNSGLLEFDGKKWRTYPIANITKLRSVLCAPDGKIYVGASNELGYYQKLSNGQLGYHSLVSKIDGNFRNFDDVWNIHRAGEKMYFQTDRSIFRYDGDTIEHLPFDDKINASAIVHDVFFVAGIQKGAFMLNGDFFIRVPGAEILTKKKIVAILPFQGDRVLFVTNFHGVYLFDGISVVPYVTGIDDFLKNNQVFSAATNGKLLVFGTVQRGIAVMDIVEGTTVYANSYLGLQNNTVLSVAFDRQQNLWLGLDKGIDYVLLNTSISNIFGSNNLYGSGYTSLLKDGKIYFGTNQGLYTASYPLVNVPEPLRLKLVKRMEGQVWNLTEIDNTLFCGSDMGAFIVYSDRAERIPQLQGTWSFKRLISRPDLILGCSYHGLFILKKTKNTWVFSHFLKGNFAETSPMFEENEDGSIWFSHWQKGMFRLYLNDKKDSIARVDLYGPDKGFPTNQNNTLYRVQNKIVFSSEYGFYLYNKQTDQMEPYEALNRLFVSPPNSIRLHESKNGDIWCVSG
ncbi:MAG: hypothetical protein LBG15_13245, partial [Dysgonamonadaceae bacterium]|nr:hypothetical protein [Dysgonamonadaceae bacterium]